jgi:hypothetical protein
MDEMNPAIAGTRVAVEFLTLWMEQDRLNTAAHIAEVINDPNGPGAPSIVAGQCNLGMLLVLRLAKERGAVTAEELGAKADQILQELSLELSRDLPE